MLSVVRATQMGSTDITHVRLGQGFACRMAIINVIKREGEN
jgi:hypothetical protein